MLTAIQRGGLINLFLDHFASMEEFARFLVDHAPALKTHLPRNSPTDEDFLHGCITLLDAHGYLDRGFYAALLRIRPRKSQEIEHTYQLFYPHERLLPDEPHEPDDITGQLVNGSGTVTLKHPTPRDLPLHVVHSATPRLWAPGQPVPSSLQLWFYRNPVPHLFVDPPHCLRHDRADKARTLELDQARLFRLVQRHPSRLEIPVAVVLGVRDDRLRRYETASGARFSVQAHLAGHLVALDVGSRRPHLIWFKD